MAAESKRPGLLKAISSANNTDVENYSKNAVIFRDTQRNLHQRSDRLANLHYYLKNIKDTVKILRDKAALPRFAIKERNEAGSTVTANEAVLAFANELEAFSKTPTCSAYNEIKRKLDNPANSLAQSYQQLKLHRGRKQQYIDAGVLASLLISSGALATSILTRAKTHWVSNGAANVLILFSAALLVCALYNFQETSWRHGTKPNSQVLVENACNNMVGFLNTAKQLARDKKEMKQPADASAAFKTPADNQEHNALLEGLMLNDKELIDPTSIPAPKFF